MAMRTALSPSWSGSDSDGSIGCFQISFNYQIKSSANLEHIIQEPVRADKTIKQSHSGLKNRDRLTLKK